MNGMIETLGYASAQGGSKASSCGKGEENV